MGTVNTAETVGHLLFGSVRRDILALLLGHPDDRFYFRELLRTVGSGSGAVQRELKQLVDAGLVVREAEGSQVYFSANRDAPIFPELQRIIEKTAGAPEVIRKTLARFVSKGRIELALVYGSVAAGKQSTASDIDLLIIGDVSLADLLPALREAEEKLLREVNVSVYPSREFRRKVKQGTAFLTRVMNGPKLFVTGDERELERLAR